MTNHPITPPPELVSKWCYEDGEEIKSSPRWFFFVCAKAARWGADQELEACCELVPGLTNYLRTARRPKPPSLKEQALEVLGNVQKGWGLAEVDLDTIRRALEQLDD